MGLDMYLNARRYVSEFGANDGLFAAVNKATESIRKGFNVQCITVEAIYWRKANAIHKWFVDHVQNGVDDRGYYPVSELQLRELLATVENVLADHSRAAELLPTTTGFFFGSSEYDRWYFEDLIRTREKLINILDKFEPGEIGGEWRFEYRSSW